MKKLIVVADDFGLTDSVNKGIVKSYKEGIVTELSLQLYSPGTDNAVQMIKENAIKDVGIHLLLHNREDTGKSLHRDDYIALFSKISTGELEERAKREFDTFQKMTGKLPTHIIPQYGIHGNLKVLDAICDFAKKHHIPMRIPRTVLIAEKLDENYAAEAILRRNKLQTTTHLFGHVLGSDLGEIKDLFLSELQTVRDGEVAEVYLHPGYVDKELLALSSLRYERGRDLALSLDGNFKKSIEALGFQFVSYTTAWQNN